jgi:hypothetical protein
VRLAVHREVILSAHMFEMLVGNDEVRGEHGRGELVTVAAVADEGVDEARGLGWLSSEWECQVVSQGDKMNLGGHDLRMTVALRHSSR